MVATTNSGSQQDSRTESPTSDSGPFILSSKSTGAMTNSGVQIPALNSASSTSATRWKGYTPSDAMRDDDDDDDDDVDNIADIPAAATEVASNPGNLRADEEEAPYDAGATDLFLAIESCEWDRAIELCRVKPDEVRVWVTSHGNDSAVFNWSVWKRLPIHEACRRQPPPVLISILLSIHPESACLTTHFGELPIHLAVGCGACPEVVNCIIAANPMGVVATDNGGRTPLEIMHETGVMRDDSDLVTESIERCTAVYNQHKYQWDMEMVNLKKDHEAEILFIKRQNDQQLSLKDLRISELMKEVKRGETKALDLSDQIDERERKIESKNSIEKNLMEMVSKLEEEISGLRSQNRSLHRRISEMDDQCMGQESSIDRLKSRIHDLEHDLMNFSSGQDGLVEGELRKAESDLRKMVESQRNLMAHLRKQRENIRAVMTDRNIAIPSISATPPSPIKKKKVPPKDNGSKPNNIQQTSSQPPKASDKGIARIAAAATASVKPSMQ